MTLCVLGCQEPESAEVSVCGGTLQSVATDTGGTACVPASVAQRPRVRRVRLSAPSLTGGATLMIGHDVPVTLDLELDAEPLDTSVAVRLGSASRKAACALGDLAVRHGARETAPGGRFSRRYTLAQDLRLLPACASLVGADDVIAWATFDPYDSVWVDERDIAPTSGAPGRPVDARPPSIDSAPLTCVDIGASACVPLRVVPSAGVDVRLSSLSLASNVAVLEYPAPASEDGEATPALGQPGEPGATLGTAGMVAADYEPELDPSPFLGGAMALSAGGVDSPAGLAAPDFAVEIAIRPVGASDWETLDTTVTALPDSLPQTGRVGLSASASPAEALRSRLLTGDLAEETVFDVRFCARTNLPEAGPQGDAKLNNCAYADVAVMRIERPFGPHAHPPGSAGDSAASDYFEIGRTETSGISQLSLVRFRGGYREVAGGHVRFGGIFWTALQSSLFDFGTGRLAEARAYHDTAPLAPDFVSGSISLLGLATIDLPRFDVPDRFRFALDAVVDTSSSSMDFGGTSNLAPLVSALNWVGKQAEAGGPKFCVFDIFCLEAPLKGAISLTTGIALAKGVDTPACTVLPGLGCYAKEGSSASHFWANASTCASRGVTMPSNHGTLAKASLLRGYANELGEPFYLGLFRDGFDYRYLLSQVFMDRNWVPYGTPHESVTPTYWAFMDVSMIPDKGACAVQAPYLYSKSMRVDYGPKTVAQEVATNPAVRNLASLAHVPCQAAMVPVCEYPITDEGDVAYERNEIYLQFAGKLVVDASLDISKELFNFAGSVNLKANLLTATWAATVGQRWFATQRPNGKWLTQGNAYGNVAVSGKLGDLSIEGKGCVLFGLGKICFPGTEVCTESVGEWVCVAISLGGLTSVLPVKEVGAYFSAAFLPFDVESAP